MRSFRKKVLKDNPGKRLEKLKKVTVRAAHTLNRDKVMVYTSSGDYNIARTLNDIFYSKHLKNTEKRRVLVCERLLRNTVDVSNNKIRTESLERFVY